MSVDFLRDSGPSLASGRVDLRSSASVRGISEDALFAPPSGSVVSRYQYVRDEGGMSRRSRHTPNTSESTGKIGQELPSNQPGPLVPLYPDELPAPLPQPRAQRPQEPRRQPAAQPPAEPRAAE